MTVIAGSTLGTAADDREHPEDFVNTNQWQHHMIVPPGGGKEVGYRRASAFGAPLEADFLLTEWKKRQVARGIARTSHLAIAVTRAEKRLLDAEERGDWTAAKAAKEELNELCEAAMKAVGSDAKASIGTSAHHIYECVDLGQDPGHVPVTLRPDLTAYRMLVAPRFRMVSVERFIVHDDLKSSGTLDRAAELLVPMTPTDDKGRVVGDEIPAGEVILADVKTSQDMSFAGCKFAVQCYIYATGTPYNTKTKSREDWGHRTPRSDWGLILHAPSEQGKAALYWVNLSGAREAAWHVKDTYEWRGRRGKSLIFQAEVVEIDEDYVELASSVESIDDLTVLFHRAQAAGKWTDELRAEFTRRKTTLLEKAS